MGISKHNRLGSLLFWLLLIGSGVVRAQTSPLSDLDALRYIASHPDLIEAYGVSAEQGRSHYTKWGFNEGRKITFEPLYYTASHPDLIEAFGLDETKSVTHYIRWGYKEGRPITFDPLRYTASHFDLIDAFGVDERKATIHYIQWGYKEKRQVTFRPIDALNYIASSFDLIAAFGSDVAAGTRHYVQWGFKEGRKIVFDALAYIASHFDLISAFGADAVAGATHYINTGFKEGRRVTFDALGYLAAHFDLRAAFGTDTAAATQHYINWGFKEGRTFLWTVSATAGPGGEVSASRLYVKNAQQVSLTIAPQSGYTIDSITGCEGSLSGLTYTTAPVTGTCAINVTFRIKKPAIFAFAGNVQGPGFSDGPLNTALFWGPTALSRSSNGDIYLTDGGNQLLRKISADGVVSTVAGARGVIGSNDGIGSQANFSTPYGVAVNRQGIIYVSDTFNHTIRRVALDGTVTTLAGSPGKPGDADGRGDSARLWTPHGLAIDQSGNIIVADTSNHTIRKISPDGVVTTLAGAPRQRGAADGIGNAARFALPRSVAVDLANNVYVPDLGNHTIRKITPERVVTTIAGVAGQPGSQDGFGQTARLSAPWGIAIDDGGTLFFTGPDTIRRLSQSGLVDTLAGKSGEIGAIDGLGDAARFSSPGGIVTVQGRPDILVADRINNLIRQVSSAGLVKTLSGKSQISGVSDGLGVAARFNRPEGIDTDKHGNLFVADRGNFTIRRVTPAGVVTTIAGKAGNSGFADGGGANARFLSPEAVAVSSDGTVFIGDGGAVRQITASGDVYSVAGSSDTFGSIDGIGGAARFFEIADLAVGRDGSIFVADAGGSTIRKIDTQGAVTTLAGAPGQRGSTDGNGATARFNRPAGIALDRAGNLFIADQNDQTIRKISPSGDVSTFAGSPRQAGSVDGDRLTARFNGPTGIVLDEFDNIFIVDSSNYTIRKIDTLGNVTTVAGVARQAGYPDSNSLPGRLFFPRDIAIFRGNIYVTMNNGIVVVIDAT